VEALLVGATSPEPPTLQALVPEADRDQVPADLAELLSRLPQADLYLQDEVQLALHPTLTRLWCRRGRAGQRRVEAPGDNNKVYGFGLVDWREGWFDYQLAPGRTAAPFAEQLARAVARSQARGRQAIVIADNLGTHTPERSTLVRQVLSACTGVLHLVYTPAYDPDANRIEWLFRVTRREVTHNHHRQEMVGLIRDAHTHFQGLQADPAAVLRHIGSPGVAPLPAAVPLKAAA
jgi:DDE superfamily endonuclease